MARLSSQGEATVDELAQRHGFSREAVIHMLFAVRDGNGGMAQFSHPEFGGSGQWMRGGMLMLGDMFNHGLKGRVDALCHDVAERLAAQPGLLHTGSFQSQRQSGGARQYQDTGDMAGTSSLFVADPDDRWWPAALGEPDARGTQNQLRYAYFAGPRRLAVHSNGRVRVYDTGDHRIGGFAQQQGAGGSITFTSQHGSVDVTRLTLVSTDDAGLAAAPPTSEPAPPPPSAAPAGLPAGGDDIFAALERLGDLKAKGILTEAEFAAKKAELLARL
ncbi:SHOCT domain-containing protein [Modicisalibacter coralii]|uniref:SHOCT domain-containing protein n=1 Tax=Modicisalibacter coralii TaxID=2304602 RepID=UPI00100AF549|nr:SHOCT domain-containing protein [Halomonas coralii]